MSVPRRVAWVTGIVGAGSLLVPQAALAYGGPGSIVSGIGALLAVLAAIVAAVFGFLWFPVKKLIRARGGDEDDPGGDRAGGGEAGEPVPE